MVDWKLTLFFGDPACSDHDIQAVRFSLCSPFVFFLIYGLICSVSDFDNRKMVDGVWTATMQEDNVKVAVRVRTFYKFMWTYKCSAGCPSDKLHCHE